MAVARRHSAVGDAAKRAVLLERTIAEMLRWRPSGILN